MRKLTWFVAFACLLSITSIAQTPGSPAADTNIFNRIRLVMETYKVDTSTPPNDKVTRKIIELRSLRGGFNVNEMVQFKIAEDREKKEISPDKLDALDHFFTSGNGKQWLNNAAVWIYRQHFSYKELKQMVRFYKTAGGKKMASDFPLVILQSVMAVETIRTYDKQLTK